MIQDARIQTTNRRVSILVLMEVKREIAGGNWRSDCKNVSILVLMEVKREDYAHWLAA